MDALKNCVDSFIAVSGFPPSFNDACVITMDEDPEVAAKARESGERVYEEFKANGFCPANISLAIECLPAWDEPPRTPVSSYDNTYSYA